MQLNGKKAVVTGGNRGIGRAISLALAEKEADVAVHFYQDATMADDTIQRIDRLGRKALKIQADIADISQVKSMMEIVKERMGRIDILVNNAGTSGPNRTLETIDDDEWNRIIEDNLTGVFNCCKAAATELMQNQGKIVNISSIAGKMGGTIGCHGNKARASSCRGQRRGPADPGISRI